MITNILATLIVSYVTNTSEKVLQYERYERTECNCYDPYLNKYYDASKRHWTNIFIKCGIDHNRGVNPILKIVTTQIEEKLTVQYEHPKGTYRSCAYTTTVREYSEIYERATDWRKIKSNILSTNSLVFTNIWFMYND